MGGPRPDPELVVCLDDGVEAADILQVDEQAGLGQPELEERQQAVSAGQELRLALAVGQDLEGVVQVRWTDVIELGRDHRATALLARSASASARRNGLRVDDDRADGRAGRERIPGSGRGSAG